ncbi:endonuclease/exonuclease/phosphatase family protein [Pedobacter nyackensis]|uniref:endonuclease/exonuclease/phosphatase family protein n=1 Tax=Pedobacter nyackensis TaxID=475255 RepID=UPI00292F7BC3|nr:endonuclease/exonuclease/phosphatase family protein [Pedobacter nyackensis]
MKKYIFLLLIFISFSCYSQNVSICSWNIQNFGKSKDDAELNYIANVIKEFDVVAIQEVVSGYGGSQAVARLADELNRLGTKWAYVISNPTSSLKNSKERYAFLWKTAKVKQIGIAWLDQTHHEEIDREPFFCQFSVGKKTFTLASFHAVPKSKQPETEIKYFKFIPGLYPDHDLIFCGDFNLPQSHNVFSPLKKMGYFPALMGQKTSLKQDCVNDNCLASEYDNFFLKASVFQVSKAGIVHFYRDFETLKHARAISDHVPVYIQLSFGALAK